MLTLKADALYMDWDQFDAQRLFVICVGLLNLNAHPILQLVYCMGAFSVLYLLSRDMW